MDAFELLDSYVRGLAIVKPDNLVVNELESFILSKEVLQVQGVIDEEWQAEKELWKQRLTQLTTNQIFWVSWHCVIESWAFFVLNDSSAKVDV